MKSTYIIVHGIHTSCRPAHEYLTRIVYGNPRIDAVQVGSHLVGIIEFAETQGAAANATFERSSTFNLGASLTCDSEVAHREFGAWVKHYAPGVILTDDERNRA